MKMSLGDAEGTESFIFDLMPCFFSPGPLNQNSLFLTWQTDLVNKSYLVLICFTHRQCRICVSKDPGMEN